MFKILFFLFSSYLSAQITFIPDNNFEEALIELGIDSDGIVNQQVLTADIENVTELILINESINDLTGIEGFEALEILNCRRNFLQEIDLGANLNLKELNLARNFLSTIDLSANLNLESLFLEHNELIALDLSQNSMLVNLFFGNPSVDNGPFNNIQDIDLSNNNGLVFIGCEYVNLQNLDVSNLVNLEFLNISLNGISDIDLSNNLGLVSLTIGVEENNIFDIESGLVTLDLSNNVNLTFLNAPNTKLRSINLKSGNNEVLTTVNTVQNNFLECIRVDDAAAASAGTGFYEDWVTTSGVSYTEDECVLNLEDKQLKSLSVYPNPVQDILNLETPVGIDNLIIRDALGKNVYENSNIRKMAIDLTHLPSGLYFVSLTAGEFVITRKIVKL